MKIHVTLHKGLSEDQRETIIKLAVENQVMAREEYISVLNNCIAISKFFKDGVPFEHNFDTFVFSVDYYQPMIHIQKVCSPCES